MAAIALVCLKLRPSLVPGRCGTRFHFVFQDIGRLGPNARIAPQSGRGMDNVARPAPRVSVSGQAILRVFEAVTASLDEKPTRQRGVSGASGPRAVPGRTPERGMALLCYYLSVSCAKAKPNRHAAPAASSLGVRARAIVVISDCDG